MARPSKYSEELVNKICERIADGESLRAICREDGMPDHNTVIRWKNEKPEFCSQYARAREMQADGLFDQALDILHEDFKGNVEVQAAKVRLDVIKWTAGKLAPKKYGEYKQVDANVTNIKRIEQMTDDELHMLVGNPYNSDNAE